MHIWRKEQRSLEEGYWVVLVAREKSGKRENG